ncbi:transmembrane protein 14C-like protein [Dimargaris cristalligena]|uniref:Transmembrane protein 14C-like protein n=1 Tax=Dimargaris cristalligena TaxID=215637 RepID=A0A4P9ZNN9_9FUNG|nr:transmembrane protein 14C-like protein [Dimargaris cristalligena]|eukprot:RKP34957.1 transmembrane protein 14C-like protein [Dimargaris cristalligena]
MDYPGFVYSGLIAIGGLVGFLKAGSMASLASGVTFGGLMALAAKRASDNPANVHLAFGVSIMLLILIGSRFYNSGKFMPAGLVSGLSLIMAIRYGARLI